MIRNISEAKLALQNIFRKKNGPRYEEIFTDEPPLNSVQGSVCPPASLASEYKNGTFKAYYDTGQLEAEGTLKAGSIHGNILHYYKNKSASEPLRIYRDAICITHKKIYMFKEYYESGKLKSEQSFKGDNPDGLFRHYYKNGNIAIECFFDNGDMIGTYTEYNEDGTIKILDCL